MAIVYERRKISNGDYIHAYSDENRYIIENGVTYGHYWYPETEIHTFTEGEVIPEPDPTPEEALAILLGEVDE